MEMHKILVKGFFGAEAKYLFRGGGVCLITHAYNTGLDWFPGAVANLGERPFFWGGGVGVSSKLEVKYPFA